MSNLIIIGISGKKKSGKDTAANYIYKLLAHSASFYRVGFAMELKKDLARMFNVSLSFIELNKDKFRLIMQGYGTDYMRATHGTNYWVERWLHTVEFIKSNENSKVIIVATDVRFQNEFDCIKKLGGITIRVVAKNNSFQEIDTHASECELDSCDKFDYTIVNDFEDINVLKKEIETLIKKEYPSHV